MSEMTNVHELAFLDFWFNNTPFTKPTILEVSWHTSSPTDAGLLTNEVDLTGAGPTGREQVTFADSTGGARTVTNTNQVNIASSAAAGNITYWGIHGNVNGQMLAYAQLDTPLNISIGTPVRINIGGMTWTFPNTASPNEVFTNYVVDRWLSHVFGSTDYNADRPTSYTCALFDGNPGDTGAVNEFADAGYARQAVTWDAASAATSGDTTDSWVRNTAQLDWTNLNSAGGDAEIQWWGIFDQAANFLARRNQANAPVAQGSNGSVGAQSLALRCN